MRLRILSNCRGDGRHLAIGEVAEVPDSVGNELLSVGLAEIAPVPESMPTSELKQRRTKAHTPTTNED